MWVDWYLYNIDKILPIGTFGQHGHICETPQTTCMYVRLRSGTSSYSWRRWKKKQKTLRSCQLLSWWFAQPLRMSSKQRASHTYTYQVVGGVKCFTAICRINEVEDHSKAVCCVWSGQFTELDLCGVPHHPTAVAMTGDQYCQEALHHLTGMQLFKIKRHLMKVLSGTVGMGYNTWSQHAGWGRPVDRGHSDHYPAAQPLQPDPEDNHFSWNCCWM